MPILIGAFLLMPDFNAIKIYNNFALLVMFVMIMLVTVQVYIKREKAFIFAATILTLCMINDVVKVVFSLNHIHMISYGIIITVLSMGVIIVNFFRSTYGKMVIAHGKAMKDPLTNAYNRNVLETIETSSQDIMVLVDFDGFKIINDVYGHSEGDRVLKLFTDRALEMLRNEDMIVRIGGDEFMIFMKNCREETALNRVERIRKAMIDEIKGYDFNFSYGSCSLKNGITQAFSKTDELLYEMKKRKKRINVT
jgi:diguanylate cyclase (GGDEF)-like protein